jgi:integrase
VELCPAAIAEVEKINSWKTLSLAKGLVSDHLRPAAIKAGVLLVAEDGTVCDSTGGPVKRFGFHNLRHSLSTALMTGEKEDPRTVQDMLRHSKVATSLELYTQSTMQQRIAAQEKYLRRILPAERTGERERYEERYGLYGRAVARL